MWQYDIRTNLIGRAVQWVWQYDKVGKKCHLTGCIFPCTARPWWLVVYDFIDGSWPGVAVCYLTGSLATLGFFLVESIT